MKKFIDSFSRRKFIYGTSAAGLSLGLFMAFGFSWSGMAELFHRIRGRLAPSPKVPPESERKFIDLPEGGSSISLETALNSRCVSDTDGDPKVFHWGMFDLYNKLSHGDILRIAEAAKLPGISDGLADVLVSGNELTFRIQKTSGAHTESWLMVASGMQQQAVCLACAALGAGMVFRNMGKDGTDTSDGYLATVKMRVDAMKPSYGNSFWTSAAPGVPWLKGNLPEPIRKGHRPLIEALSRLKLRHSGSAPVTDGSLGQVLWAARGRTPHLYKSRHCGMTIPTWAGEQHISGVYLIRDDGMFEYRNESKGTPTHSLAVCETMQPDQSKAILEKMQTGRALLVFTRNEAFARAFWEVGYQLLNAILQSDVLGLSYDAMLLDDSQKAQLESAGVKNPVAALALR